VQVATRSWAVGDIQCVGPRETDFAIDVANGRVTVTHSAGEEHICAFTNRKLSQGAGPSPGVSRRHRVPPSSRTS
jgi:hypothetical protein